MQMQFQKIIDEYETKMAFFDEHYNGRADAALLQGESTSFAVIESEKRLNPLLLLGGSFKKCVVKYSVYLPKVLVVEKTIATCQLEATKQLTVLLSAPRKTRNDLQQYLEESYEANLKGCANEYQTASANYTECITSVTALANTFVNFNQKRFASEMEAAVCTAKANIKGLLDCVFTEQERVISLIAEVKMSVRNCLDGKDECKPCEKYTCLESYDVHVNTTSKTVENPFFGREHHNGCFMLNAV